MKAVYGWPGIILAAVLGAVIVALSVAGTSWAWIGLIPLMAFLVAIGVLGA